MSRPSNDVLVKDYRRDLLNDARVSLRYARELRNGANPAHYGQSVEGYEASAASNRLTARLLRDNANAVVVGRYGVPHVQRID